MNPSHYPDLERCKKLTELGFPETQYFAHSIHSGDARSMVGGISVCPSVMELLDVVRHKSSVAIDVFGKYCGVVGVPNGGGKDEHETPLPFRNEITLPNALADLIIWLVENGHLTFDKR